MEGTRLFRAFAKPVDGVVRAGYRGYRSGNAIVIPGFMNKLGDFSVRISPRVLVRKARSMATVVVVTAPACKQQRC